MEYIGELKSARATLVDMRRGHVTVLAYGIDLERMEKALTQIVEISQAIAWIDQAIEEEEEREPE